MSFLLLISVNFLCSILLGSFLYHYIQVALIQILIEPITSIGFALLATRSPLLAPIIVYVSGLLYTLSYSLYHYNTIILYTKISGIFTDTAFISAVFTFILTLLIAYMKKL